MSAGGLSHTAPPPAGRKPVNLPRLAEMKAKGEPIAMITAYDYPSAKVAEEAGADIVLVGDSAANVGDKVIVASYANYDERDMETYAPVVVHVDEDNRTVEVDSHPEVLLSAPAEALS